MDLTIITATWRRHALLAHCIRDVQRQADLLEIEHIVVSDGPDEAVRKLCDHYRVKCLECDRHNNNGGTSPYDLGLSIATGEYVCLWDDDNLYEPHAASALFASARGHDLGVIQVDMWLREERRMVTIPELPGQMFRYADIDTANVCFRRSLLQGIKLADLPVPWDLRLWEALKSAGASINFVPTTAITHV